MAILIKPEIRFNVVDVKVPQAQEACFGSKQKHKKLGL